MLSLVVRPCIHATSLTTATAASIRTAITPPRRACLAPRLLRYGVGERVATPCPAIHAAKPVATPSVDPYRMETVAVSAADGTASPTPSLIPLSSVTAARAGTFLPRREVGMGAPRVTSRSKTARMGASAISAARSAYNATAGVPSILRRLGDGLDARSVTAQDVAQDARAGVIQSSAFAVGGWTSTTEDAGPLAASCAKG